MHSSAEDGVTPPQSVVTDKECLCSCKSAKSGEAEDMSCATLTSTMLQVHFDINGATESKG